MRIMRKWGELSSAEQETIRSVVDSQVREYGHAKWREISSRFNVNRVSVRFALVIQPERENVRNNTSRVRRRREAEALALVSHVPDDQRTLTGCLMGDPLPGRSALGMQNGV